MEFKVGDKCKIIKRDPDNITGFKERDDKNCYIQYIFGSRYCLHTDDEDNEYVGFFSDKEIELIQEIDLLEQAKLKYPVGTKFKCLATHNNYVILENTSFKLECENIYSYVNGNIFHKHYDKNGKWAEIISKPEVEPESKSLVGRYLKALVDHPNGGGVKQGEYGLITHQYADNIPSQADFPSQKRYSIDRYTYNKGDSYKLMPEGFIPDSIKPQFEVGKWYEVEYNYNNRTHISIFKCENITDDTVKFNDYYSKSKHCWENGSGLSLKYKYNSIKEKSINEIQQYLPDEHLDKIIKVVKYKAIPFPKEPYIELEVIRELKSEYDVDIPVGSRTWVKTDYIDYIGTERSVHIEKNRHLQNFKGINFRLIRNVNIEEAVTDRYEPHMTVTFNPSQNTVPIKLNEYPVSPLGSYQVIDNLKSKENSNKLDASVKSTYVSLPEVKKKSKTIKF